MKRRGLLDIDDEKPAPKKDRPGLLDDAARLAEAGRRGDKIIAHITPSEAALLKARGGSGTVNPKTGLLEFFEGSTGADSHGSNSDGYSGDGYGGGSAYGGGGQYGGMDLGVVTGIDTPPAPPTDPYAPMPGEDRETAPNYGVPMGPNAIYGAQQFGAIGNRIGQAVDRMTANPIATGINTLAGLALGPVGVVNSALGLFGAPTIGSAVTGAGRAAGNALGIGPGNAAPVSSNTTNTPSVGQDGYSAPDNGGGNGDSIARAMNGGGYTAQAPQGQSPADVAREAVRRAVLYKPQAFNFWDGNRFAMPTILNPR